MGEIPDDDMVIQLRQLLAGSGQSFIGQLQINIKAVSLRSENDWATEQ
jgi:hypothetical protein